MSQSMTRVLHAWIVDLDENFVLSIRDVDDDVIHARPGEHAPSIAFHLWHIARWADLFQSRFPTFSEGLARLGPREQIWESRGLAATWGMPASMGRNDSGWGLDDDASASLPLPGKDELLGYASSAFAAAEQVFGSLEDEELMTESSNVYDEDPWKVIDHVDWYTGHGARHLGMIEALKGVLGRRGTVTS